jgi:WD40 repeat protein
VGTAGLWDLVTGREIAILPVGKLVWSAMFSPDGKRVVTASADGTARVWDVEAIPKGDLFQIACAWLPDHDLTDLARDYALIDLEPICAQPL